MKPRSDRDVRGLRQTKVLSEIKRLRREGFYMLAARIANGTVMSAILVKVVEYDRFGVDVVVPAGTSILVDWELEAAFLPNGDMVGVDEDDYSTISHKEAPLDI